jgi:hypothetical protein
MLFTSLVVECSLVGLYCNIFYQSLSCSKTNNKCCNWLATVFVVTSCHLALPNCRISLPSLIIQHFFIGA